MNFLQRKKAAVEMQQQAQQLRSEFQSYLEDLELFSKADFWRAIQEKPVRQKNLKEYAKKVGA